MYPAFQAWAGVAGETLHQVLLAIGRVDGEEIDSFFAGEPAALGGVTPVEAPLGRTYLPREQLSDLAAEVLGASPAQRLARIVEAAEGWFHR